MPYLIDGHNLIPKMPGMSLSDTEDELELVERLQQFCRASRHKVEVYFDKAPLGYAGSRRYGSVMAHFVREGRTADRAIADRLRSMKKSAANWTVVSSDHEVQSEARAARAQVLTSEEFARLLVNTTGKPAARADDKVDHPMSDQEVEEWLRLFKSKKRP